MKTLHACILGFFATVFSFYGIASFILWDANPGNWKESDRVLLIVLGAVWGLVVVWILAFTYKPSKSE